MPRAPIPDAAARVFRLSADDRDRLARIAATLGRRKRHRPNATAAVRWAIRELDARLGLEEQAATTESTVIALAPAGPITPPP